MTTTVSELIDLTDAAHAAGYLTSVLVTADALPAVVGTDGNALPALLWAIDALHPPQEAGAATFGLITPHGDDLTVTHHTHGTTPAWTITQTEPDGC